MEKLSSVIGVAPGVGTTIVLAEHDTIIFTLPPAGRLLSFRAESPLVNWALTTFPAASLTAKDQNAYGATGHVDLIYEDFYWDLSINSYGGKDLIDYLKDHKEAKFTLEVWVLEKD